MALIPMPFTPMELERLGMVILKEVVWPVNQSVTRLYREIVEVGIASRRQGQGQDLAYFDVIQRGVGQLTAEKQIHRLRCAALTYSGLCGGNQEHAGIH